MLTGLRLSKFRKEGSIVKLLLTFRIHSSSDIVEILIKRTAIKVLMNNGSCLISVRFKSELSYLK